MQDSIRVEATALIMVTEPIEDWDKYTPEEKQRREKIIEHLFNEAAELRRNGR